MSTIKANQWLNSDGTENFKCRAWVNFDGTGTVAIRASGNVSSITDNGVGDYTINFLNQMPDANYAFATHGNDLSVNVTAQMWGPSANFSQTVSGIRLESTASDSARYDFAYLCVSIHR